MNIEQKNKVGLVSFHFEYNYGTMLQAYALWRVISDFGYDAEYISFSQGEPKSFTQKIKLALKLLFTDWYRLFKSLTYKKTFSFWNYPDFTSSKKEFDDFHQKYIPHTMKIYTPENLVNETPLYQNYIVGSDQTWSPHRYNDKNPFFLSFINKSKLKNSYAPSLGTSIIPDSLKPVYKKGLESFNNISCREKLGCDVIEEILQKKVFHVLDPTLLLKAEQWEKVAEPTKISRQFILCYILGEKKCIRDFAEKLGEERKLPVYYILTSPLYLKQKNKLSGIGPSQFIGLIKNSAFLITDSYHGTLFAINFQKNFYSFMKREGNFNTIDNGRIIEILNDLSLEKRFKEDGDYSFEPNINYQPISVILEKRRTISFSYLKTILEN